LDLGQPWVAWFDESGEWRESNLTPYIDGAKWDAAIDASLMGSEAAAKGWKPAGFANETPTWLRPRIQDKVNEALVNMKRASDRYAIKRPVKWSTTIDALPSLTKEQLELYYGSCGYFQQRWMTGIDPQTFPITNERSKPVGLKETERYKDASGRNLLVGYSEFSHPDKMWIRTTSTEGAYIRNADAIALALNVLGHDRPGTLHTSFIAEVGGYTAGRSIPGGKHSRDGLLADAIASLQAVDAYDQREAKRKAEEEAAAKRAADYAKHKQESFDRAKQAYADAIRDQIASGIDAESAARVQAALSAYETARRKLEGLPS
jgi:hypothetical protein